MPELPDEPYLSLRADWACEVLSPSTAKTDRADKLPIYARESVGHVWFVDPQLCTLEVFRLDGDSYRLLHTWSDDAVCRAEPFEAIELPLGALWAR